MSIAPMHGKQLCLNGWKAFVLLTSCVLAINTIQAEQRMELGLAYAHSSRVQSMDMKLKGKGIQIGGGPSFDLGSGLKTTSSLLLQYLITDAGESASSAEAGEMEIASEMSGKDYNYGIYQKLVYELEMGTTLLMPFVELGYARGKNSSEQEFGDGLMGGEVEVKRPYNKFSGTLGVQALIADSLLPFVKYTYASGKYSETGTAGGSIMGMDLGNTEFSIAEADRKFNSHTVLVGMGMIL